MHGRIRLLTLACGLAAAIQIAAPAPASAAAVNLVCDGRSYWIDAENKTVVGPGIATSDYYTYPLQVTALTYTFGQQPWDAWLHIINRNTGVETVTLPNDPVHTFHRQCTKGLAPPPAAKF